MCKLIGVILFHCVLKSGVWRGPEEILRWKYEDCALLTLLSPLYYLELLGESRVTFFDVISRIKS